LGKEGHPVQWAKPKCKKIGNKVGNLIWVNQQMERHAWQETHNKKRGDWGEKTQKNLEEDIVNWTSQGKTQESAASHKPTLSQKKSASKKKHTENRRETKGDKKNKKRKILSQNPKIKGEWGGKNNQLGDGWEHSRRGPKWGRQVLWDKRG